MWGTIFVLSLWKWGKMSRGEGIVEGKTYEFKIPTLDYEWGQSCLSSFIFSQVFVTYYFSLSFWLKAFQLFFVWSFVYSGSPSPVFVTWWKSSGFTEGDNPIFFTTRQKWPCTFDCFLFQGCQDVLKRNLRKFQNHFLLFKLFSKNDMVECCLLIFT